MSAIISCQVDDLIKKRLDEISEKAGKTQSTIMRDGILRELTKLEKTISTVVKEPKDSKKLGSLTTMDSEVINAWKKAYKLGDVRVFSPPVKAVLNNLRKDDFSQQEILTMVINCRKVPMVRKLEEMNRPKAPPLSSILSSKMVPHLLFLLDEDMKTITTPGFNLDDYKREVIDSNWLMVGETNADEFREDVMSCTTIESVQTCVDTWCERFKEAGTRAYDVGR